MDSGGELKYPDTLSDWLGPGLRIISVGLNPSPASVAAQVYFAHPRNRFWPALRASGLIDEPLKPSLESMQRLFEFYRIGFTDLVKRPTPGAAQLRAKDYREGSLNLHERLKDLNPTVIWFQGRTPWVQFLRYTQGEAASARWGAQVQMLEGIPVWVTPNPSPANAAFRLEDLTLWMRGLATWLSRRD